MSKIKKSKSNAVAILEKHEIKEGDFALLIVNCTSDSLLALTDVLRVQINSRQRRFIACLTDDDFAGLTGQAEIQDFLKTFISNEIDTNYELDLKVQQKKNLNLLEVWKKELDKDVKKRKSLTNKVEPKTNFIKHNKNILDCPEEYGSIKLFLVLINVYNYNVIRAAVSMDSSFKTIINMFPRYVEETEKISEDATKFWNEIVANKFTKEFENLAFIDMDAPANVPAYLLELRESLIYNQMCYLFYDMEDNKSNYQMFLKRMEIIELKSESPDEDLEQLNQRLQHFPEQFISVELVYEMIIDQICEEPFNDLVNVSETNPFILTLFEKEFYDMNDNLFKLLGPNNKKNYTLEIKKQRDNLIFWNNVPLVEDEERRILNYFLIKIQEFIKIQSSREFLEFNIYILQSLLLDRKASKSLVADKHFHENRSVSTTQGPHLKVLRSVSDFYVDYQNTTKIPAAIAELIEDEDILKGTISFSNPQVQLKSSSAMVQYLTYLLETYDNYHHEYFKLLDVILIKFKKISTPHKLFTSKSYFKIIPTPVCFRDFIDYVKYEIDDWIENKEGEKISSEMIKESFISKSLNYKEVTGDFDLTNSLKYRRNKVKPNEDVIDDKVLIFKNPSITNEPVPNYDFIGYNISNQRVQLDGIESIFHSFCINIKATIENWLNLQKYLNYVGKIMKTELTFSYDFMLQKFNEIVLLNDGLRFCIEQNNVIEDKTFELDWNVSVTLKNNLNISNITLASIEQSWFNNSPIGELKRITFANGFVLIYFQNGMKKGLSANGTIYQFADKPRSKRNSAVSQITSGYDTEATEIHKYSINFVQFLKNYLFIWKFKMTLPNGLCFSIENGNITEQHTSIKVSEFNTDCGNTHLIREDGVKILYSMNYSKCLFDDGTVITSRLNDQNLATIDFELNKQASLNKSILEEIWWTQATEDVQLLFDKLLDNIPEDYFVNIKKSVRIEHKHYGCVYFGDNTVNLSFYNGTCVEANQDRIRLCLNDGVQLLLKNSEAKLSGKKCEECFECPEICLNYKVEEELLISAHDMEENSFEILKNGKQRLYENDSYIKKYCSLCLKTKEKIEKELRDRLIVLNRDYSGYEISLNCTAESVENTIQTASADLLYEENKYFCNQFEMEIYDKDVNVEKIQIYDVEFDKESVVSSVISEKSRKSKSQASVPNSKKRKPKRTIVLEPEISPELPPPWITENKSIAEDVLSEQKMLIKYYNNPLDKIPKCLSVKSTIKVNGNFECLVDALAHLKKYSTVKSILKMPGLNDGKGPAIKRTFDDNFKIVVQKTITDFISEDLKKSQEFIAGGIVDLLLMVVVKDPEYIVHNIVEEFSLEVEKEVSSGALPVALKSFSFC
ncbi:unnamed protein product [Diamesa tonsa]